MKEQDTWKRDKWGKLDVIFKGCAGVLIPCAVAFYGFQNSKTQTKIAEAGKQAQVLVQTMNQRETAAASMRAQMFDTLMQHYFEKEDQTKQLALLELIGLNFQDHIHLRPLFEKLDAKLVDDPNQREELRKAVKRILRNEIEKIVGTGGEVFEATLAQNETWIVEPYNIISLTLLDVQDDYIKITSDPEDGGDGFSVNFFDMPLMDNTRLGELTYSVVLCDTDKENKKAKIKCIILPKYYYSSRNSLRFDAMIGDLIEKQESE